MSLSKLLYPLLVLVKPRKTRPDLTENVDYDVKNQSKQNTLPILAVYCAPHFFRKLVPIAFPKN